MCSKWPPLPPSQKKNLMTDVDAVTSCAVRCAFVPRWCDSWPVFGDVMTHVHNGSSSSVFTIIYMLWYSHPKQNLKTNKKKTHTPALLPQKFDKNTVTFRYVHTSQNNAGDKIFSCIFPTLRNHSRNALGRNTLEIQERKDASVVRRHCFLQSAQRSFSVRTSGPKAPKHRVMIIWRAGMRTD